MSIKKTPTETLLDMYLEYRENFWFNFMFYSPKEILFYMEMKKELDKRLKNKGSVII